MKETVKKIAPVVFLALVVLFILVNIQTTSDAISAAVALAVGLVGGLLWIRYRAKKNA